MCASQLGRRDRIEFSNGKRIYVPVLVSRTLSTGEPLPPLFIRSQTWFHTAVADRQSRKNTYREEHSLLTRKCSVRREWLHRLDFKEG